MMFSLLSSLILASAVGFASAGDICTYTSRSCIGSYGCCYGIAQNTCCYWPSNYGWSVKFQNMPMTSTWLGTTYGDSICSTQTGGIGSSSGSACKCRGSLRLFFLLTQTFFKKKVPAFIMARPILLGSRQGGMQALAQGATLEPATMPPVSSLT